MSDLELDWESNKSKYDNYDKVIIQLGTNDIQNNKKSSTVYSSLKKIANQMVQNTEVVLVSLAPSRAIEIDTEIYYFNLKITALSKNTEDPVEGLITNIKTKPKSLTLNSSQGVSSLGLKMMAESISNNVSIPSNIKPKNSKSNQDNQGI